MIPNENFKPDSAIVDVHTHPELEGFPEANAELLLKRGSSFGVRKMCVLGNVSKFGENPDENDVKTINDESINIVKEHPDNFFGFCFLNPGNSREFIFEELSRCVQESGFKGIKLWVSVKIGDRKLDPVMEKAEEYDIPVLQHAWYKAAGNSPGESNPSDVACIAARFPNAKIIMGHLPGCGMRGVIDIEEFPSVYVDTGGAQPVSGLVEFAVKRLGAGRILFGSDFPCRDFPSQLGRIYGAGIKSREKNMILGKNAEKLLKLS